MQPWPLLGIAQLIVAMNDTLPQLGTAVRMQLPGYGWVVEGSVARLEASHTVHGLDSKRTSRHTRKEILSCISPISRTLASSKYFNSSLSCFSGKRQESIGTAGRQRSFCEECGGGQT